MTRPVVAEQIERSLKPIQQFVRGWMMSERTTARALELGLASGNDFWIIGRAGAMGDCSAVAAASGLGFLSPAGVQAAWGRIPTWSAPSVIATEYAALCCAWGTAELSRFESVRMARLDELGRRIVDAADGSIGPVFAGWKAMAQPDDLGARVALTTHVLRELRGAAHIMAIFASGITPLDAVLASPAPAPRSGPVWAEHLHWTGPFRDADDVRAGRVEAEKLTSRMLIPIYSTLTDGELIEYGELTETTRNAIDM